MPPDVRMQRLPQREVEALQARFRQSVFPVLVGMGGFYAAFSGTLFLGDPNPWTPTLWALTLALGLGLAGAAFAMRRRPLPYPALVGLVGGLAVLTALHALLNAWLLADPGQSAYLFILLAAGGLFLLPRPALAAFHATALLGWPVVAFALGLDPLGADTLTVAAGAAAGWGGNAVLVHSVRSRARDVAQFEGSLQASEARFRTLAETAKDAIFLLDPAGRITYLNPAGLSLFGLAPNEVDGRALTQHLDLAGPLPTLLGTHEVEVQRRDGTRFAAELALARAQPDGDIAYTGILRDITERKQAATLVQQTAAHDAEVASLRQMNEFKTRFLNMAAHELNTPLTPLRLQLHLLKAEEMGKLNERQARAIALLDRNVLRLSGLVGELLEVARIQGGRLRLVVSAVPVDEVVDEVLESFEETSRRVGVQVGYAGGQGLHVLADRSRLTQVLFNLVSNAIKFTPAPGRVTVEAHARETFVEVAVTDTGLGLTREQQARLFQPFVQVHDPNALSVGGTGLGLYISRGLIEAQGGTLTVTSPGPGKGSTFRFTLPVPTGTEPPGEPPVPVVAAPEQEEDAIVRRLRELI